MKHSSNPYSPPETKAVAIDSTPSPNLMIRGVRVGLAIGLLLGACVAGFFIVMHGVLSVLAVLAFLAGPAVGVILGAGLAVISRREHSQKN